MNTSSGLVMVSGASGFIASHCIIQLLAKGYKVRGTVRSLKRAEAIKSLIANSADIRNFSLVEADLNADSGWHEATEGCTYVLHVASPLPRVLPKDAEELIRPAKQGALRVLKAASDSGVKRVVMTASTASIFYGYGNTGKTFTESDWSDPESQDNSAYTRSKTYAERAAWEFMDANKTEMELCTINPGAVLGPVLESDYGTSAEIVLKLLRGELPGKPKLGFPLVDVRDVADLHIRAMESDQAAGERFLCANDFMWMGDVSDILKVSHPQFAKQLPSFNLPNWMIKLSAIFDPVAAGVTFELGIRRDCDSSKAKSLLGWKPRSNKEAIIATADSVIKMGLV